MKYDFRQFRQKTKSYCEKRKKKWKILPGGTKIDYIMWGIILFYLLYYFNDFNYVIDYDATN